ncbi:MAG: hypothetical protein RL721_2234 [Candidatus Eisenbacteria bacterium]
MGRKMGLSPETPMRIAVIGAGVAGLAAAARLHPHHDITVYEAESHLGGHALTRLVDDSALVASLARPDGLGRRGHDPRTGPRPTEHAADLGFMVWNRHTYPGLTALFERLGTATAPTSMGFSSRCAMHEAGSSTRARR